MKSLRQVCAAIVLSLAFSVSVSAGDIHCPGVVSTGTTPITTSVIVAVVMAAY